MLQYAVALLLLFTAGVCTVRTRFVPFRRFRDAMAVMRSEKGASSGVTPLEAAATSLAATIGTGNIAGVAGALLLGGPGVVFWMWISALLGMGAKYVEILLGLRCRKNGIIGPMAYIRANFARWSGPLAAAYAFCCLICCLCMGNLVQVNTVAESILALYKVFRRPSFEWNGQLLNALVGIGAALLVGFVSIGGAKRIGRAAALLVPIMSFFYLAGSISILVAKLEALPHAFASILRGAWTPQAFLIGISRGMFSHEGGLGTAAIAHGSVETQNAGRQALYGIFEVFFDTIVICTLTALAVLASGIPLDYGNSARTGSVVMDAFAVLFGPKLSALCISLSLCLFAFSSILSFSLYSAVCADYLWPKTGGRLCTLLFPLLLILGACIRVEMAWKLSEWANLALGAIHSFVLLKILLYKKSDHQRFR